MSGEPTAKISFRVPDHEGGANVETLWATPIGNDHYKLDNSPFYAYGVSWQDTVWAPFDAREGMATFQSVVTRSGHRTIRIIVDPPVSYVNASELLLQRLVALGCSYEGATGGYISVDIPPSVDLQDVHAYLIDVDAQWEQADPPYESRFPREA